MLNSDSDFQLGRTRQCCGAVLHHLHPSVTSGLPLEEPVFEVARPEATGGGKAFSYKGTEHPQ